MTDPTTPQDYQKSGLARLLEPFPESAVSHLPRGTCRDCTDSPRKRCDRHQWVSNCTVCGGHHSSAVIHLDYVGHADVTVRLLEADPLWSWEPVAWREDGTPARDADGGMWIRLTVCGVTRLGYGDSQGKRGPNGTKELIGDALRNAAMRFGVAVDLWSKSDAAEERKAAGGHMDDTPLPDEPDADALEKLADEVLSKAAAALGDRQALLPLYRQVQGTPGLADFTIGDGSDGTPSTLGAFIVWAGDQSPAAVSAPESGEQAAGGPEGHDPAVVDCEGRSRDGRACVRPAGHDGNHKYEEQA